MVYSTGNMELEVIATCLSGSVNDVVVCRDLRSPDGERYTLIVVHDRDCVKKLLSVFGSSDSESAPYLFCFAQGDMLIYGFPFRPDRKFSSFAPSQMISASIGEKISVNLVMECISSPFPPQLIYLILTQDNVHITKENDIYFSPVLDLSLLDTSISEKDCTICCANIILDLLDGAKKKRFRSFELIGRKCQNDSYSAFSELYRDIRLTAIPENKPGFRALLLGIWLRNRDKLFRIFLILCGVAAVAALIMLISQLILGDIPLLRLFRHCFDVIGTEHMK